MPRGIGRPVSDHDELGLVRCGGGNDRGALGFIGDVNMSAVKRDLKVKDSGGLIPGHGGILDRVDSLTYAAPVFLHFVMYFFVEREGVVILRDAPIGCSSG